MPNVSGLPSMRNGAQLRLQVGWDDIPGNPVLHQTVDFDGTPDGFDAAVDEIRVKMHESARSPMRPCGHPGPWHELEGVVEPTEGSRASTQAPSAKESAGATAVLRPCSPLEEARASYENRQCPTCRGTGGGVYNDCPSCDGNGVV